MRRILPSLAVLALSLAGCAGGPDSGPVSAAASGDPLEATNRDVLDINLAVDDAVLRPIAVGYRAVVPEYVRDRVRNVLANMQEPRIFANNVLQGRFLDAGHTTMRFFLNSTAGLGGLYDIAGPAGIERRTGDFGQTLHAWGLGAGPYLMLPLVGPSNPRDLVGSVADGFLNPINYLIPTAGNVARTVVDGVDTRERNIEGLDTLREGSLDFYARLRSVWTQRRAAELGMSGGEPAEGVSVLDDPGAATTPVPGLAPASAAPALSPSAVAAPVRAAVRPRPRVTRAAVRRNAAATRRSAVPAPRPESRS